MPNFPALGPNMTPAALARWNVLLEACIAFGIAELSFGAFQSVRLVRNDWGSTAFPAALGGTPEYLIFFAVCSFLAWCIEPLGVATNAIVVMLFLRIPLVRSLGWGIIVIVAYGCILTAFGLGWFATVIHFS